MNIKVIDHFYVVGTRSGQRHKIRGSCPYELSRTAYFFLDDEIEFFMVLNDGTEEQYTTD